MMFVAKSVRIASTSFPVITPRPRFARNARNVKVSATTKQHNDDLSKAAVLGPLSLAVPLLQASPALAINREYGILEGQIFSLMHPAVMFFLFGATVYTGYLGVQWRRTRELGEEIRGLKAQRVPVSANADAGEGSSDAPPPPSANSGVEAEISRLEAVSICRLRV